MAIAQATSYLDAHCRLDLRMAGMQHWAGPPEAMEQPCPPHSPHEALQHTCPVGCSIPVAQSRFMSISLSLVLERWGPWMEGSARAISRSSRAGRVRVSPRTLEPNELSFAPEAARLPGIPISFSGIKS